MNTRKPGPRKRYGNREPFRLLLPIEMKQYIDGVSNNTTEWILEAIRERMKREEATKTVH